MNQSLPVGVVGVGALGRHHARHLAAMPGVELVGVCDIDPRAAAEVAAASGCRAFASCGELLAHVAAVTIAVPTPQHHAVGLECLDCGVAVLMEKPFAVTLEEADELIAAAERNRVLLAVGHVERFNRAMRAAYDVLDRPAYIEGVRLAPFQPRGTDVAVVLDLMIHDLDLALHLVGGGPAVEVRASGVSIISSHLDIANARVEFAGGAVASVVSSRVARERVRRLRIFQPSGYISLDLASGNASYMRLREGWRPGSASSLEEIVETVRLSAPEADALELELAAFVAAVRGEPAAIVTASEGRAALALALEVTRAVQRIPVPALGAVTVRILVTAGEPSGDMHGARVVTALRRLFPDATIDAVGGPRMAAAGASIRRSIEGLTAIGLFEILGKIPAHWRLERELRRDFRAHRYDLVIPIDYPGFHVRLARFARRHGIPVLWYIAPQLWGWWPRRAVRFAQAVDRLAVILPFESAFFRAAGLDATYVGHPLLDSEPPPDRATARTGLGLGADARVLAIFPGSRRREVAALWPVMRDAALELLRDGSCAEAVVAGTAWGEYPGAEGLRIVRDDAARVLAAADAVIAKSGTTTLQAALANVPMVVAYAISSLSFRLMRRLLTTRWVALPNLIAERQIVPELIQHQLTRDALVAAVRPLLDRDSDSARAQREGLAEVRRRLGEPGASERVARIAGELLAA